MSEPVSNAEIEDVLSSIRRLVSENTISDRPVAARLKSDEKLVLTPAFRVLDGNASMPEAMIPDDNEPSLEADEVTNSSNDIVDILDGVDDADAEQIEPEDLGDNTTDLSQKIAALEAAIGDTHEEWEPDGSEQEAIAAEPIVLQRAMPAHVVELRAAEHKEEPEQADLDMSEADAEAADIEDIAEDDILTADTSTGEDGAYLDEEMLREMVTQLIREELRGDIGERITRNVRRLVRREIKRALAVHDLG